MTDAPRESHADKPKIRWQNGDIAVWILFVLLNIFWCGYGLYPVQRALFLSGYDKSATVYQMLPQTVPIDAADYDVSFVPALPQGGAVVKISFYSDAESLAAYRQQAEQYGAACYGITDDDPYAQKWLRIRTDEGMDMQDAAVYIFLSGYHSAYYIINESTGYFELYYC